MWRRETQTQTDRQTESWIEVKGIVRLREGGKSDSKCEGVQRWVLKSAQITALDLSVEIELKKKKS